MYILFFLILFVQFVVYWIFEPVTSFVEYALEIRLFPSIAIFILVLLFSAKNIDKN